MDKYTFIKNLESSITDWMVEHTNETVGRILKGHKVQNLSKFLATKIYEMYITKKKSD